MKIRCIFVFLLSGCSSPPAPTAPDVGRARPGEAPPSVPKAAMAVRMYVPDPILGARIGDDIDALATYVKALEAHTRSYWSIRNPAAGGILIAVGVKPGGEARAWCDAIGGAIEEEALRAFEASVAGIKPVTVRQGPLAFALEITFQPGAPLEFPEAPLAWMNAARISRKPLTIPDDLFAEIWP